MKHLKRISLALALLIVTMTITTFVGASKVNAAEAATGEVEITEDAGSADATSGKAIGAAIAIGLAAAAGAIGMGLAIAKSNEGIARQPEAEGSIRALLMLGLVFIETVVIYALIVAILIVFVM